MIDMKLVRKMLNTLNVNDLDVAIIRTKSGEEFYVCKEKDLYNDIPLDDKTKINISNIIFNDNFMYIVYEITVVINGLGGKKKVKKEITLPYENIDSITYSYLNK